MLTSHTRNSDSAANPDYRTYADAAMVTLQRWYNPANGLYEGVTWWHAAICLDAVIDYTARTRNTRYLGTIATTFDKNAASKFVQNSYDDMAWWALAWVNAYDLTGEMRYLAMAKTIFTTMKGGWDDSCGGGVWWNFSRDYKNAIPNELFLALAARLYQRCGDTCYLTWATREWSWFNQSGMINSSNLINDGLNDCQNNGGPTWTYNQGVILAGLTDMYKITGDISYLAQAEAIANATINTLVNANGILIEPCEDIGCDSNGAQFKGIFMRNLYYLYQSGQQVEYRDFILKNVNSLWQKNRNKSNQFGVHWAGPFDSADASRQSSAMHAINAAIPFSGQILPVV